jgi:hypothetical protein
LKILNLEPIKTIENKRKITGNEVLFICKVDLNNNKSSLSLHKQSYSDGTCFYTLQNEKGNWDVRYGNGNIQELIKEIEWDIEINSKRENEYKNYPQKVQDIYNIYSKWYNEVLDNLKKIA